MRSPNRRILIGFIVVISLFTISEIVSFRNLEKSKEINSRNALIYQPSIIYLNEIDALMSNMQKYTESWVFFDVTDHSDKVALRELHAIGVEELTSDLKILSEKWDDKKDVERLNSIIADLESIMMEQSAIMEKLRTLDDYSKDNWLVLLEVEDERLVNVKTLVARSKKDIATLVSTMKEKSLEEKNIAAASFRSIRIIHIILGIVVVVICIIVAWSILRFLRSEQQKKAITVERDEIKEQKAIIEEKNAEILSSISYAKRLQHSMLPSRQAIAKNFREHFIFYKPRDIVSGDFYWYRKLENDDNKLVAIAAADATGHGVPGAFVSFVCYSSLNRAVDEFKLTDPAEILEKASEFVSETFSKSASEEEVSDGMDIALAIIDSQSGQLHFSGANNSAYILREGTFIKLDATRRPVGRTASKEAFKSTTFQLIADDHLFIFSDGFQDQFGGPKGKKYRIQHLLDFLQHAVASNTLSESRMEEEFNNWKGEHEQLDDVLVIALKID